MTIEAYTGTIIRRGQETLQDTAIARVGTVEKIECAALVELSTEFLEGALAGRTCVQVVDHLDACRACQGYLDEIRTVVRLANELPPELLPPRLAASLLASYREWVESAS